MLPTLWGRRYTRVGMVPTGLGWQYRHRANSALVHQRHRRPHRRQPRTSPPAHRRPRLPKPRPSNRTNPPMGPRRRRTVDRNPPTRRTPRPRSHPRESPDRNDLPRTQPRRRPHLRPTPRRPRRRDHGCLRRSPGTQTPQGDLMTNHRPGRTNTRDPRGHRYGKQWKRSTARLIRQRARRARQETT